MACGISTVVGKTYEGEEHEKRLLIFYDNLKFLEEFYRGPKRSYTLGISKFSDLTDKEFKEQYTGGYKPVPENIRMER